MSLRFYFLATLIFLEFILNFIPIYILFLITNLMTTLIWYIPSIYQLYIFIFTANEFDLRIRVYLFFFSPMIIILYIPICTLLFVGYSIFITLVVPLATIMERPEYPVYSLSSMTALIRIIYKCFCSNDSIYGLLTDSLLFRPFKNAMFFTKHFWLFNSMNVSEKIRRYKLFVCQLIVRKLINLLDLFILILTFTLIIIPYSYIFGSFVTLLQFLIGYVEMSYTNFKHMFSDLSYKEIYLIIVIPVVYSLVLVGSFCYYVILRTFILSIFILIDMFVTIFEIYDDEGFYKVLDF